MGEFTSIPSFFKSLCILALAASYTGCSNHPTSSGDSPGEVANPAVTDPVATSTPTPIATFTPTPVPGTPTPTPIAYWNWKNEYDQFKAMSPIQAPLEGVEFFSDPNNDLTSMTYFLSRYRLKALSYMYDSTQDLNYLELGRLDVAKMFDGGRYFKDCHFPGDCNGIADGLKGWKWARDDAWVIFPPQFQSEKNAWIPFEIQVKDLSTPGQTEISLWMGGSKIDSQTTYGDEKPAGTIALMSSWAKTSFRGLQVVSVDSGGGETEVYSLENRLGQFESDWQRIQTPDCEFDTGSWSLNGAVITSDATDNPGKCGTYPYSSKDPNNFGMPASGSARGRPSTLVLMAPEMRVLKNYKVRGEIRLEKRNNGVAEMGIQVRVAPPANFPKDWELLTAARRVTGAPFPGGWPPAIEQSNRNTHIETDALAYKVIFQPKGARITGTHYFLGAPDGTPGVGGGHPFFPKPRTYDLMAYEGGATLGPLAWARNVYQADRNGLLPAPLRQTYLDQADLAVTEIQNNIAAKFYRGLLRHDPGFVFGGLTGADYDGDENRLYGDVNRGPLFALELYKISRDFPEHWAAITQASMLLLPVGHPARNFSSTTQMIHFYEDTIRFNARLFIDSAWRATLAQSPFQSVIDSLFSGEFFYQWFYMPKNSFWNAHTTWGGDLQHNALTSYLLTEAMDLGIIQRDEVRPLARTFTNVIWNQKSKPFDWQLPATPEDISVSLDIHGHGSGNPDWTTISQLDYWITLSKLDFKVYEIINTWLVGKWPMWKARVGSGKYSDFFGIQPALMYAMVKYGTPKEPSVQLDADRHPIVRWNHPSDWPGGTTLPAYRVYRRAGGENWTRIGETPSRSPMFVDLTAQPRVQYTYTIRSVDTSYTRESDPSASVNFRFDDPSHE